MKARGYITKSKAGHYTAKAVDAAGHLIAIQDKLCDLPTARRFIADAIDPDSDFSRQRRHRDLHRTVHPGVRAAYLASLGSQS